MVNTIIAALLAASTYESPAVPPQSSNSDTVRLAPGSSLFDPAQVPRGEWTYQFDNSSSLSVISIRDTSVDGTAAFVIRRVSETRRGQAITISLMAQRGFRPISESYSGPDGNVRGAWEGHGDSSDVRMNSLAFSEFQLFALLGAIRASSSTYSVTVAVLRPHRTEYVEAQLTVRVEGENRWFELAGGPLIYGLTFLPSGLLTSLQMTTEQGQVMTLRLVGPK